MISEDYKEILEEYVLPEILDAHITRNTNLSRFIQCVLEDNPDWVFDYAEILDCDPIKVDEYVETGEYIKISFVFSYILTLWHEKKQLARVTADAEGTALCPAEMPLEWEGKDWDGLDKFEVLEQAKCVELLQLQNSEEEYDDTSFFD